MTARLPEEIRVNRLGKKVWLLIEGVEFPFVFDHRNVVVNIDANEMPTVTITLIAETVNVYDAASS